MTKDLVTLAIDIGGTGLKSMLIGLDGKAIGERARVETPHPADPTSLLAALFGLIAPIGPYDRISVGFPGVVVDGVTKTAPNLDPAWADFDLAGAITKQTSRPVRILNDAGVQGYGIVAGKGVEMVLTFGTGLGCALYHDGVYVPNLELAHHPFGRGKQGTGSYEDYVDNAARKKLGKTKWNKRVGRVIEQVLPIWNPRMLYLGGGNAKHIELELPPNVVIADNLAGLTGGIALWHDAATNQVAS